MGEVFFVNFSTEIAVGVGFYRGKGEKTVCPNKRKEFLYEKEISKYSAYVVHGHVVLPGDDLDGQRSGSSGRR